MQDTLRPQEPIGRNETDLRVTRPPREQRLQDAGRRALPDCDAASHSDDTVLLGEIFSNGVVVGVGNNHIVAAIDAKVLWSIETCFERFAIVPGESFEARSGNGANFSTSIHNSQRVSAPFQNVEQAL